MHELRRQLNSDELSVQERVAVERELEELKSGRAAKVRNFTKMIVVFVVFVSADVDCVSTAQGTTASHPRRGCHMQRGAFQAV
jgi:hypothetical protein